MKKEYLEPTLTLIGLVVNVMNESFDPYGNDFEDWGDVTDEY